MTVKVMLLWAALGLLAANSGAQAESPTTRCFNGYGYGLDSGQLRYVEHHEQVRVNGKPVHWNVRYYSPDGKIIATKTLDFSQNDTVPVYTFRIPGAGYVEGIDHENGRWRLYRREGKNAEWQTKTFHIASPMAADSGFNTLVHKHFRALMDGRTLHFKFAVAGHLSVIDMQAEKTGTTRFEGRPAVVFKVELDSFLLHFFVKPILLTYDPQSQRLLEYRGTGNMHNDKGDVYPVRVSYYDSMPKPLKGYGIPRHCSGEQATPNS